MTPYDDAYPSCDRTCAKLLLYPNGVDPAHITARLQIEPTIARSCGDVRQNSRGEAIIARNTVWFLKSEQHVDSRDLRRHIDWLLDAVEPRMLELRQLQTEGAVGMVISLVWWSAEGLGGPVLWPEHLGRLANLGIECQFDFAFYGADED